MEEALTIAWMFLNAVFVFLMQVCRQHCQSCRGSGDCITPRVNTTNS